MSDGRPTAGTLPPTLQGLLVWHGARVRLARALDDRLPAGSEGRVFGYVRRPEGEVLAVAFDVGPSRLVDAVELELVDA